MADDPYRILRVRRGASQAEIRQAFIKLAKKYHPDLNPGKKRAEERFKRLNAAYAQLATRSDPQLGAPVSIGPDGTANLADPKPEASQKAANVLGEMASELGYDLASAGLAILKFIDLILTGIWTVIKTIFALR